MRLVIAWAWEGHAAGDVVDVDRRTARRLIRNGRARAATPADGAPQEPQEAHEEPPAPTTPQEAQEAPHGDEGAPDGHLADLATLDPTSWPTGGQDVELDVEDLDPLAQEATPTTTTEAPEGAESSEE